MTPEFKRVYDQAFESATGEKASSAQYVRELKQRQTITDSLIDRSGDDDRPAVLSNDPNVVWIDHPGSDSFNESDRLNIARISLFGRKLIDLTGRAIQANPRIKLDNDGAINPDLEVSRFNVNNWYKYHPAADDSVGELSESAKPNNWLNWPEGDYINCLGMSIAQFAIGEMTGQRSLYANVIRPGYSDDSQAIIDFCSNAFKQCNIAFGFNGKITSIINAIYRADYPEDNDPPEQVDMYKDGMKEFEQQVRPWEQFHHMVLKREGSIPISTDSWYQVDPYMMKVSNIGGKAGEVAEYINYEPMSPSSVLLLRDFHHDELPKLLNNLLVISRRSSSRINSLFNDYKSANFLLHLEEEMTRGFKAMEKSINNNEPSDLSQLSDDALFGSDTTTVLGYATRLMLYSASLEMNPDDVLNYAIKSKKHTKTLESLDNIEYSLFERIRRQIKYDPNTLDRLKQSAIGIVHANAVYLSQGLLSRQFQDKGYGLDHVVEIGNPEFQIGCLYLNHYAKCKKDVTINVASELARINPSQLMLQSAMSYSTKAPSEAVISLQGVYRSIGQSWNSPTTNASI